MKFLWLIVLMSLSVFAQERRPMVKGMNLTQLGGFIYDANPNGPKTPAQVAVDQIYDLGARHVVLNPQARMSNPYGNDVVPDVGPSERNIERTRYRNLINYIRSKGMTVGLRPIFFVVGPNGEFPYIVKQPDGSSKTWWHGNIQPSDPNRWFESFKQFHDIYLLIARLNRVEEYTLGAELYSMTVGIEDQWPEQPFGFPRQWLQLLRYAKTKVAPNTRMMYDINFTDDRASSNGELQAMGGEFERWRYRLVDLASPSDPEDFEVWQNLVNFWKELDAIGIDMYRSLASREDLIPRNYNDLVPFLRRRSDEYANQIDIALAEIESVTDHHQYMIFKEVGFRSVDSGFIDPFDYETGRGNYNDQHMAAAFQALYESFWEPQFSWFQGASFWDVSVSPSRNGGAGDTGFSPVGKPVSTGVLRRIFSMD